MNDDKEKGGATFAGGEPEKIHTMIPEAYRTLANSKGYVMNLGTQRSTFNLQLDEENMNTESVRYDEKNGLWRTNEFVMTEDNLESKKEDESIGKDYIDPWVY